MDSEKVENNDVVQENNSDQVVEVEKPETIPTVEITVVLPTKKVLTLGAVSLVENCSFIKQSLSETFETCFYTNFRLENHQNDKIIVINEFADVNAYGELVVDGKLELVLVVEDYDIRSAKAHVKRIRDLLIFPPQARAEFINDNVKVPDSSVGVPQKNVFNPSDNLPTLTTEIQLSRYFEEVLYKATSHSFDLDETTHGIQSISFSGWNPPPPSRKIQGDFFYLEILLDTNNSLHVTVVATGFFVNQSTKSQFNPLPASQHHFSHELLGVLVQVCESFKQYWAHQYQKISSVNLPSSVTEDENNNSSANALDLIATLYLQGKSDLVTKYNQWLVPSDDSQKTSKKKNNVNLIHYSYDMGRAIDDLTDNYGMEEKGAPREWNEEIQTVRQIIPKNLNDSIIKSRYLHRIVTEFTEACRALVVAVSDGQISSINPMETEENQVFVYNNIFVSRSVDTKETFKVYEGNTACRKAASQDLKNQRIIESADIDGLHTVLTTIVDYKGIRYVAQSIIPGILQSNEENNARLMYGTLQENERLKCKKEAWRVMSVLKEKLLLSERTVKAIPNPKPIEDKIDPTTPKVDSSQISSLLSLSEMQQAQMIKVDNDDEEFPIDSETVSHIGPFEGKILKGSDGRMYAFEMNRLTPRDANYVKSEFGGTGNLPEEYLANLDQNISLVYSIRSELLPLFIQEKVNTIRQEAVLKVLQNQKEKSANESSNIETPINEESKIEADKTVEDDKLFTSEVLEALRTATPNEITLNPNCFLPKLSCAVDSDLLKSDEENARLLASFLWSTLLPQITNQIRVNESSPLDGSSLTTFLHLQGVNMRYLGRLAYLSLQEEKEDASLYLNGQQRRQPMPYHWLELLDNEMTARAVKQIVNDEFAKTKAIRSAPAATIVKILNHLFGSNEMSIEESIKFIEIKDSKAGKKSKSEHSTNILIPKFESLLTKDEFWSKLKLVIYEKFTYTESFWCARYCGQGATEVSRAGSISARISPTALLRRICQICGFRIMAKNYDFKTQSPFSVSDVHDIVPLVKSCESDYPFPEARQLMETARVHMQHGNLGAAFELAQEGSRWIQQVTGPVHKETLGTLDFVSKILVHVGDFSSAISTLTKILAISVQLYGLDSVEVFSNHLQLVHVYQQVKNFEAALSHLSCAKYILNLINGSSKHVELANICFRLSNVYSDLGINEVSVKCLLEAKSIINANGDQAMHSAICGYIGDSWMKIGNYREAIAMHKQHFLINKQIFGDSDQNTLNAKAKCEKTIRAVAELEDNANKEKLEREKKEAAEKASMWLDDDIVKHPKKSSKSKKSKSKK